ncbi:MAG: protein phosphatase 2C domain-containing protein [Hyphomicrobiaceae bacterium]|nr:protein phosphatase 2C domain-containing protein [Hyphomicrobiaceae bacterium]
MFDIQTPPSSVHLQTFCAAPWVISLAAQKGKGHIRKGEPYQDAYAVAQAHDTLILAIADGVGSKPRSHDGAATAVSTVVTHLISQVSAGTLNASALRSAFTAAHTELQHLATTAEAPLSDYAATLAAVAITPHTVYSANLGDSSVAALIDSPSTPANPLSVQSLCSAPQPSSAKVLTLVHDHWPDLLTTHATPSNAIRGVILATDGANNFFSQIRHPGDPLHLGTPFIDEMHLVHQEYPPHQLSRYFAEFLFQRPADNNDDRTLIVAYRSNEQNPEQPAAPAQPEDAVVQPT